MKRLLLFGLISWGLSFETAGGVAAAAQGTWKRETVKNFWGERSYYVYLPSTHKKGKESPLFVGLHGCKMGPLDFAGGTRVIRKAEELGMLLVMPEQTERDNPHRCWNWFVLSNQMREQGEPSLIMEAIRSVVKRYGVSRDRIYLAGISAGAAMANTVMSCYPEYFSGVTLHSGVQFRAASDPKTAGATLTHGSLVLPEFAGGLAAQCGTFSAPSPKVLIVHGALDTRVVSKNADQIERQVVTWNDWRDDLLYNQSFPSAVPHVSAYLEPLKYSSTVTSYRSKTGVHVKKIIVEGLAHAWSGGDGKFPYQDPKGPDVTEMMFRFFVEEGP